MAEPVPATDMNLAWQAMLEGRYSEALDMWKSIASQDPSERFLMNRGVTHLMLGQLEEALIDFSRERSNPGNVKMPVPLIGATLWVKGDREGACDDWAYEITRRRSGEITNADEAGGVIVPALLWWASSYPQFRSWRALALDELKRRWRTKQCQQSRWPGPVAGYLVGKLTEDALVPAMEDFRPFRASNRCQANFYLAASALDSGDSAAYRDKLAVAVRQGENSMLTAEYHLVRSELRNLEA